MSEVREMTALESKMLQTIIDLRRALESARTDVNTLNSLLRDRGLGQGEIDHYAFMESEITRLTSERDNYKLLWERDSTGLGVVLGKLSMSRAVAEDRRAQLATVTAERDALREEKNNAYSERNHLVAALAKLFPSGVRTTSIEGWDQEWNGCCYIDLPSGQISYHYHDSQSSLFAHLPRYDQPWDGHSKDVVHQRLAAIDAAIKEGK